MVKSRVLLVVAAVMSLVISASQAAPPRNVIILIGDGMGFEHVKAAGMYRDGQPGGLTMESLPFQGQVTTYSANSSVTDSAAAATAIATGHKVDNGVISRAIPGDASELQTLLEYFRDRGRSTGLVTTTYVTHATPAGFGAHESSRNNYNAIADDYLNQSRPDVVSGGGRYFTTSGAAAGGYDVVTSRSGLAAYVHDSAPLAALFGTDYMPYEYDYFLGMTNAYDNWPHLSETTAAVLDILNDDPDGFFLLVEGGRIDHASHSNLLAHAVFETIEFDNTVQQVVNWTSGRRDTLVVVTADHETGGLRVTRNNGQSQFPSVTWSTGNHTGANVPVFADGPNAEMISGTMNNTDFFAVATADTMPALMLSTQSILNEVPYKTAPSEQSFTIRNSSLGTAEYAIVENAPWLEVAPAAGECAGETDTITLTFDDTGLETGIYDTTLTVTSANARNAPQTVAVRLNLLPGPPVDTDEDDDVDQSDFGILQACLSGSGEAAVPECRSLDFDGDTDVDGQDVQTFLGCMSAANVPYDLDCLD